MHEWRRHCRRWQRRWKGPGGQDIAGTSVIVRHAYDAQDNGNAKLLISNLNWDSDGWPRY
jgi:arabinan endo-1,5-alpha-L-arabinosidase